MYGGGPRAAQSRRSRRRWPKRWSRLGGASCWPFEGPEAVGFADTEVRFPFSECASVGAIHQFYVREDARGRNVGSAMLVSLTTQFKAAGCVSVQAPAPAST
ncbi:MAG: GNAT family N-acetyltransferase [Ruthenibacterium lactatiformans]